MGGHPLPGSFNWALLALLPKKDDPQHRLQALCGRGPCARAGWARGVTRPDQSGCMLSRSIVTAVIELEAAAVEASLAPGTGMVVSSDLAAAFPGTRHDYVHIPCALGDRPPPRFRSGRPVAPTAATLIGSRVSPRRSRRPLRARGSIRGLPVVAHAFHPSDGRRGQGSAIFRPGDMRVRGFVDDLGVVMRMAWVAMRSLGRLFAAVAPATGLRLGPRKCGSVPLWPQPWAAAGRWRRQCLHGAYSGPRWRLSTSGC